METPGLNCTSWWTVDTSEELQMTVGATPLVLKCTKAFGWSLEYATRVLDGYKKLLTFMHMFQDFNAKKFFPPIPVDLMWQQHTADAAIYEGDCQLLFGRTILRPTDYATLDAADKNRRIDRTLYVLRLQCKEDFDRSVWDFGRTTDVVESKKGLRPRNNRVDEVSSATTTDTTMDQLYRPPSSSKKRKTVSNASNRVYVPPYSVRKRDRSAERRNRKRKTSDGDIMKPYRPPRLKPDGTYSRPAGRLPSGMVWDKVRGLYVRSETPVAEAPKPHALKFKFETPKPLKQQGNVVTRERSANRNVKNDGASRTRARPANRNIKNYGDTRTRQYPEQRKTTEDGCILPNREPRKNADGTYIRPVGRTPQGMFWDENRGLFAPIMPTPPPARAVTRATTGAITPASFAKPSLAETKPPSSAMKPTASFRPPPNERKSATGFAQRKAHRSPGGSFHTATKPKKNEKGQFVRPRGRAPAGMIWSKEKGCFVAPGGARAVPCVTPTASLADTSDDGGSDIFNGAETHAGKARRVSTDSTMG